MNGAKFRLIGLSLISGAALAVGCSGDDSGGDDDDDAVTSTTVTTTTVTSTNNINSATSSQSTNGTSNGTTNGTSGTTTGATGSTTGATGSTTGTGGATTGTTGTTTGTGGTGGDTCEDPPPIGGGSGNEGGGAGEGGAAGASGGEELTEGFNFVDESEVAQWSIVACADDATDCVDDESASVSFSCGVLHVEIDWPESANTGATKFQIQNVVPEDMLRDLSGKTLYARVRMTSDWIDGDGYDFDLIAQDYIVDDDDGNDWKWFSTCYNGSGACPDNPSGETWAPPDWVPLVLPMEADLAPAGFAFDGVRKFAIQIATKHWADGEPFTYDSAPTGFDIDYVAW